MDRHLDVADTPGSFGDSNAMHDMLEPIAIIGLSHKFPQDADTPASFWKMLEEKRCAMTEWPKDRINLDAFFHRDSGQEHKVYIRLARFAMIIISLTNSYVDLRARSKFR